MSKIIWKKFLGQERVKQVLSTAFANSSLGHAYLFTGDEGYGTLAAAIELAMACLCESTNEVPCYACASCEKVLRYAHPDFNFIFPVFMQKEHRNSDNGLSPKGWDMLAESARSRIADPYTSSDERGQATIPVEWIREVNQSISRGVLAGPMHVAVIAGIHVMNKESANALLKTLEEPPPRTLLLLCTERPQDLLPTIHSRCQVLRFGFLSAPTIETAIKERLAIRTQQEGPELSVESLRAIAAAAQGSLRTALDMAGSPIDEELAQAALFWNMIEKPDWLAIAPMVDDVARGRDFAFLEKMYLCFIFLIRNSFLQGVPGAQKYINSAFSTENSTGSTDIGRMPRMVAACEEAIRGLKANGNAGLLLTNFLIIMMEIRHGKE